MNGESILYSAARREFDVLSPRIHQELVDAGILTPDESLQVLRRYRVAHVLPEALEAVIPTVFADPAEQEFWHDPLPIAQDGNGAVIVIPVEYHPGQFDQRADAAEQVLRLLGHREAAVTVGEVFVIATQRDTAEVRQQVIDHLVNAVDSYVAELEESPSHGGVVEEHPPVHHFSPEDQEYITQWFAKEGRQPTETEYTVLETYWSDHCRHTTFQTELRVVDEANAARELAVHPQYRTWQWYLQERARRGEAARRITLMDIATALMRWRRSDGALEDVVFSEEVNACTVRVPVATTTGETIPTLVLFKNETHNHPTEIEPYGGAATCLGGAIRDPLSGRGYVYQAMRVSGSADPRRGATPPRQGKLLQRTITRGAARGFSSYGNQIGVATGLVDEVYHPGYVAKRLEMGAVVGAVPEALVRREEPSAGDRVLLIGGRTGRDGIGGATGSSRSHDSSSINAAGAEVQKGNPPVERALQRLFRNPEFLQQVKRCNDFGAGGVAVAVGEIAAGLDVQLDAVPLKYHGLTPREIAVSESQERMAVVVPRDGVDAVIALAAEENLEATVIAAVTETNRLIMRAGDERVVDISREFLDSAGVAATVTVELPRNIATHNLADQPHPVALKQVERTLQDVRYASREGLSEWFDNSIGAGTLLAHSSGRLQRSPATAMAARIPLELYHRGHESTTATVMAYGCDPDLLAADPYRGAYIAVVESIARIAAAGSERGNEWISLQEYFPRPGTDATLWGLPLAALLGALQAQQDLQVTAIGGKDSMSGTFEEIHVPPTVVSVALGVCREDRVIPSAATAPDHHIMLLYTPATADGLPDISYFTSHRDTIQDLGARGILQSAVPVRGAGAVVALAQMLFGEELGFEPAPALADTPVATAGYGSFLIEIDPLHSEEGLLEDFVAHRYHLGSTTADGLFRLPDGERSIRELYKMWSAPLGEVFSAAASTQAAPAPKPESVSENFRSAAPPRSSLRRYRGTPRANPRVVIPVFPGTNCEDDSAQAFLRAGAVPEVVVLRTGTAADLEQSIATLAERLREAQILMLPGGFSSGDEPGGSGKYIAAVFRAAAVRRVVEDHFLQRDRLILGICNGFQGLIRLGWVPFGEYRPRDEGSPVLAPNLVGRHVARVALTKVATIASPWLHGHQEGEIISVPVSHGEGRFWCPPKLLQTLETNGQVATQYVDWNGRVRMDHPWNPNGSSAAVEGLLSPDGRILGKMGHTERRRDGLYRHVPQVGTGSIFDHGVAWFR